MSTEVPLDKVLEKVKEAIVNQPSEEKNHVKCLHHFGYLSELPKNSSIPEECFFCPKVVNCIVKL
jgi:hypothetical protein